MSKDFSVTAEKILDNARLVCYTFSIDKARHLCYITIKRKVAMRVARMVYIKDMDLTFFLKGSIDLMNTLNIKDSFVIECKELLAAHEDNSIEVKFSKDEQRKMTHITYTCKIIAVVWDK